MHDFFLVFIVRSSQLTCLWMSAYAAKGNLTRFSHDSGVMIFHLKIGSSGKKSLVKCSRTASIMSNFTTWHCCVKDVKDKKGSIAEVFTTWHYYRKQKFTDKCSSEQVFKCSSVQVQVYGQKGSSVQGPPQSFLTTLWYFHGPTRSQSINKTLNPLIKSLIRDHPHHLPSHHIFA